MKEERQAPLNPSRGFQPPDFHHQGGDNLLSRGGTAVISPLMGLAAKSPPCRLSGFVQRKHGADALQIPDDFPGLSAQPGNGLLPGQKASALQGVLNMAGDAVPVLTAVRHGVDSPGGHHGLGPLRRVGGCQNNLQPVLRAANGTGHAGNAASDYQHGAHDIPPAGTNMTNWPRMMITAAARNSTAPRIQARRDSVFCFSREESQPRVISALEKETAVWAVTVP